ncbi:MAG: SH3 domain-containing protein [Pseudomonadota bacterium]
MLCRDGFRARVLCVATLLCVAALPQRALALFDANEPDVVVSDPYIEFRTGAGRGYPIFYVIGQGDRVTLLKRKTDWFKVRGPRGQEGWVHIDQMAHTLNLDGEPIDFRRLGRDDFTHRRWEMGVAGGDFGGANLISGHLGFALTPHVSIQLEAAQILGNFSDGLIGNVSAVIAPWSGSRISPYFMVGTGIIRTEPQASIVATEDREDEAAHAGIGANVYLSDRFIFRIEYKRHTVLTSRDDNEEIDQWKTGFSVFF